MEGQWKDGKEHGQGTATFADGRRYEGKWEDRLTLRLTLFAALMPP